MSSGEKLTPRQITVYAVAALVILGVGIMIFSGSGGKPQANRGKPGVADPTEEALAAARDALNKGSDLNACQSAVHNLNLYLSRNPADKPPVFTESDQKRLAELFDFDASEWAELQSPTFTPLDAHYLDLCFLMGDAARSLGLEKLEPEAKAMLAFEWVVRQVRLEEQQPPAPPQFVLRRGSGTALERCFVFLAILDQLGLDGCVVVCPQVKEGRAVLEPWAAGVLVGNDVLLFDARLGMPLPGPNGQGIATLAQVRAQPQLPRSLTVDSRYPYDLTAEQLKGTQVLLVCSLSALAPRWTYLERLLAAHDRVKLTVDAMAQLERFKQATAGQGIEARWWTEAVDARSPVSLLRRFLPAREGGTDTSLRKQYFTWQLVPWQYLPQPISDLPAGVPPGSTLRGFYAELFAHFPLPPPRSDDDMAPSSEQAAGQRFLRFFHEEHSPAVRATEEFGHFLLAPGSARDHMLRGRFDQAITQLVATQDQVKQQQALLQAESGLPERLAAWSARAERAQAAVFKAEREMDRNNNAITQAALESARRNRDVVWNDRDEAPSHPDDSEGRLAPRAGSFQLPPWLPAVVGSAATPMGEQAGYLLALCKQDQAVMQGRRDRGQATPSEREASRDAWRAAADQWETYLENYPASWRAGVGRGMRAQALAELGDRKAAAALLQDLSGELSPLEKTGRLYQAQQLRQGKEE